MLTTQYLEEADQLADEIVVIDHGHIIAEGTPLQLKDQSGAAAVVVTVSHADDLPARRGAAAPLVPEVHVDEGARQLSAPASGLGDMTRIAAAFDGSGIELDDLGLKRPSLDDVFLHLTGHRAEEPTEPRCEEATPMTHARRPRATRRSGSTGLLTQSLAITRRNLIHIKRMPEMLMDVTIQPVMFVLLFAFVFGGSIAVPGVEGGYNEWLMAGIMGQTDRLRVVHRGHRPHRRHRQGHRRPDALAAHPPRLRPGRPQHLQPDPLQHRHRRDVAHRPGDRLADPDQRLRGGARLRPAAAAGASR